MINILTNYYYILFLSIIIILFTIHFIIKRKYGFWYYQPVVHSYDIIRLFKQPQIINIELPSQHISKYYQPNTNILSTMKFHEVMSKEHIKEYFMHLIKNHYLKTNHGNVYNPNSSNIWPYFVGHNYPCFFSFYYNPLNMVNDKLKENGPQKLITNDVLHLNDDIIGTMTSRPLYISFNDKYISTLLTKNISVYYIEFLCVNEMYRKKGIAQQLIQTHEYNQRHINKEIKVSLFKHEDKILEGIVPLCVYKTYGFDLKQWYKSGPFNITVPGFNYKLIRIKRYSPELLEFIKEQKENNYFDVFIDPHLSNIDELIKTNNLYIFALFKRNKKIAALYVYKNTCVTITKSRGPILCLTASLKTEEVDESHFIFGFKKSMSILEKKYGYDYFSIENIAYNDVLLNNVLNQYNKNDPIVVSPTAYFFYNLIFPTIPSNRFFVCC